MTVYGLLEMNKKYYTEKAIKDNALYQPVKLIDFEGNEYEGWLIPFSKKYILLPINIFNNIILINRRDIKSLYNLRNNNLIFKR